MLSLSSGNGAGSLDVLIYTDKGVSITRHERLSPPQDAAGKPRSGPSTPSPTNKIVHHVREGKQKKTKDKKSSSDWDVQFVLSDDKTGVSCDLKNVLILDLSVANFVDVPARWYAIFSTTTKIDSFVPTKVNYCKWNYLFQCRSKSILFDACGAHKFSIFCVLLPLLDLCIPAL